MSAAGALSVLDDERIDVFDPQEKTLGLCFPGGIESGVLLALAAANARESGIKVPNVALIPTHIPDSLSIRGVGFQVAEVHAKEVCFIDAHGGLHYKSLDEPVKIDVLAGLQPIAGKVQRVLKSADTLNPHCYSMFSPLATKDSQYEYSVEHEIPTPYTYKPGYEDDIDLVLASWIERNGSRAFVVKPIDGSLGRDASFHSPEDLSSAKEAIERLIGFRSAPIIQERIESFPYYQGEQRFDWNIRATYLNGVCSLTVRYGPSGDIINKSKGAVVDDFYRFYEEIERSAPPVENIVSEIERQCALLPKDAFYGVDFIVDEDAKVWLLEVNGERSGGLRSAAEISECLSEALSAPGTLLRNLDGIHREHELNPLYADGPYSLSPLGQLPKEALYPFLQAQYEVSSNSSEVLDALASILARFEKTSGMMPPAPPENGAIEKLYAFVVDAYLARGDKAAAIALVSTLNVPPTMELYHSESVQTLLHEVWDLESQDTTKG